MLTHNTTDDNEVQPITRKGVGSEKKTASRRAHEVPSQLMPCLRRSIEDSMRAGRSTKQCSAEYGATQGLVLETWLRAELRRITGRLEAVEDKVLDPVRLRMVA